jgi:hypothetical protein
MPGEWLQRGALLRPGEVSEVTLTFDHPGTYTFYCDRWCGPNHWRMRGTTEVTTAMGRPAALAVPAAIGAASVARPFFVTLGIDPDTPHPADVLPQHNPSAVRGAALGVTLPIQYLTRDYYRAQSPVAVWHTLRAEGVARDLTDQQVWDLVALVWRSNAAPEVHQTGWQGYAKNCAACHGEIGRGDGVLAPTPAPMAANMGGGSKNPVNDYRLEGGSLKARRTKPPSESFCC